MFVSPTLPRDFNREFLALATRAIDRTFYKKRFFVMADTLARVMAVTANRFQMSKLFVARAGHTLSHSTGLRPPRPPSGRTFWIALRVIFVRKPSAGTKVYRMPPRSTADANEAIR